MLAPETHSRCPEEEPLAFGAAAPKAGFAGREGPGAQGRV